MIILHRMVRKTKKHTKKIKGVYSIPEIRRSFEHIEEYVDNKMQSQGLSKEHLVKDLRREWSRVFFKELDKKSAELFINDRLSKKRICHKYTRRRKHGGAQLTNTATPIAGSPNDYTTRQGMYLAPGQIPDNNGHLPLSDGSKSSFGSFTEYIDKGFWNPEPGSSYDPVPGQPPWPVPPKDMGDNTVHFATVKGGYRRNKSNKNSKRGIRRNNKTRQKNGGSISGAILSQAFSHPISASAPPGILQDAQDIWYGKPVGPSPDQVQREVNYQM